MRTTLIGLAEKLYTDVESGVVNIILPSKVDEILKQGRTKKKLEEQLTELDEASNYIQQQLRNKVVDKEVHDNAQPRKRKRNTKAVKGENLSIQCHWPH